MPPAGNPTVQIRLPEQERERWRAAAEREACSLPEWVRRVVTDRLDREETGDGRDQAG